MLIEILGKFLRCFGRLLKSLVPLTKKLLLIGFAIFEDLALEGDILKDILRFSQVLFCWENALEYPNMSSFSMRFVSNQPWNIHLFVQLLKLQMIKIIRRKHSSAFV